MFAPKTRPDTSNRRDKPYARKQRPMPRSSSLLGTIKEIVSAPLSWFASNQGDFEDLGKRRRVPERDLSDAEEGRDERVGKRMRVHSPEPPPQRAQPPTTSGYLDPLPFSSHTSQLGARMKETRTLQSRRPSIFGGSLPPTRTMSVDPPSRYSSFSRDPASVPLPGSPVRSSPARSLGPDDELEKAHIPFRLRTTLTPQPSPARPLRRESSAPPPLSTLHSHPVFVKLPREERQQNVGLAAQKTVSLGTLADLRRANRAPSRNKTLTSLGRVSNISDQITSSVSTDAVLQPSKTLSERTFQELELYKTPILPSRYKDATTIPPFLRPKRSHVPIPMKKGREPKPSLGMGAKSEKEMVGLIARNDGKPYAGKGSVRVRKMLARRKAEEAEEQERRNDELTITSVEEEDEMETDIEPVVGKRDIGISARMTSGSEDERAKMRKSAGNEPIETPAAATPTSIDPFTRPLASTPGGRQQPYGRVGRSRNREPGQRSVPLLRPPNKISAAIEGERIDHADQSMRVDDVILAEAPRFDIEKAKVPGYEVPKVFSFAADASIINHDYSTAKEPPIPALPVSLTVKPGAPTTDAGEEPKEIPSFKPPAPVLPSVEPIEEKKDETIPLAPSLSDGPPTAAQPAKEAKQAPVPSNFFAAPPSAPGPSSTATPSTELKPAAVPNFFGSSPFLTGNKSATSAPPKAPSPKPLVPTSGTTPVAPVKDPENPLWNGANAAPSAPPKLFAQAAKPFSFGLGAKPADETATASAPAAPAAPVSLFGGPPKKSAPSGTAEEQQSKVSPPAPINGTAPSGVAASPAAAEAPQMQPAEAKPLEPEKKANGPVPSPFFNFGGTTSNVPKPLFGTGAATTMASPFPMQPSQPSQTGDAAPKPIFSFGQPQPSDSGSKMPSSQPSPPSQNGTVATEQKLPFTFGAPTVSSAPSNTSTSAANDAVAMPKPLFGGPSTGTGFTFGSTTTAPSTEAAKPASPFAFGAPPATPPAGERKSSPFAFGAPGPSSVGSTAGFTFGTPIKQNGAAPESAPSTPTTTSTFAFGAQTTQPARPVTPPSKPDEGMSMEESPVQMDTNGGQKKPTGSITFGLGPTPVNPFGPGLSTGPGFTFGAPSTINNPFAPKDGSKSGLSDVGGGFNFNRTSSAPAITTSFSFGTKPDQSTAPTTAPAFGAPPNPFGQSQTTGATSAPFTFGQQPSSSNPFGVPAQSAQPSTGSAPSSPFSGTPAFTFGASSGTQGGPFAFGSSTPSSPAAGATGLPQTSTTTGSTPAFTFGQSSGGQPSSSGGALFNIGAPPPNTGQRAIKKLPRRSQQVKR